MDHQFCKDLCNQLRRRAPMDNSNRPVRRYADCLCPGEEQIPYAKVLIVIDGYMKRAAAQRLFDHVVYAFGKEKLLLYQTRFYISLWAAGGCEAGGLTEPKFFSRSSLLSGLSQVYEPIPNMADLNDLAKEILRLPARYDLVILLSNCEFLDVFDDNIKLIPALYHKMLMLLSEDARTDARQRLHDQRLSEKTAVLCLQPEQGHSAVIPDW